MDRYGAEGNVVISLPGIPGPVEQQARIGKKIDVEGISAAEESRAPGVSDTLSVIHSRNRNFFFLAHPGDVRFSMALTAIRNRLILLTLFEEQHFSGLGESSATKAIKVRAG